MTDSNLPEASTAQVERVSFFDEQARRRRGTWRLSLICLTIACLIGAVVSSVISPLLLGLAFSVLHLLRLVGLGIVADWPLHALSTWTGEMLAAVGALLDHIGREPRDNDVSLFPYVRRASGLLVPGMLAGGVIWLLARRMHLGSATTTAIATLAARAPRDDDFEEHQLANIVAETALAAGIPTPALMIIDTPLVNAAAFGRSHEHATVIVTRGLLDRLDRTETQALIADVVASVGAGDLALAASLRAVFTALGLLLTGIDLLIRVKAWRAVGSFLRAAVSGAPQMQALAIARTEEALDPDSMQEGTRVLDLAKRRPLLGSVAVLPFAFVVLAAALQKLLVFLWMALVLGWPLGLLWRTRRYLADASAVQLTRDPDSLVRALNGIASEQSLPEGGKDLAHAFVHAPDRPDGRDGKAYAILSPTPSVEARAARLAAMGARDVPARTPRPMAFYVASTVGSLILAPLLLILFILIAGLTINVVIFSAALGTFIVAAIFGIV